MLISTDKFPISWKSDYVLFSSFIYVTVLRWQFNSRHSLSPNIIQHEWIRDRERESEWVRESIESIQSKLKFVCWRISEWIDGKWCAEQIQNIDSTDWMTLLWLYSSIRWVACVCFSSTPHLDYHLTRSLSIFLVRSHSFVRTLPSFVALSNTPFEIGCTCWFWYLFVFRWCAQFRSYIASAIVTCITSFLFSITYWY